jgi:hypothetical protein
MRRAAEPVTSHVQRHEKLAETNPATMAAPASVPALNKAWNRTIRPGEPPSPTVAAVFIAMSTSPAEAMARANTATKANRPGTAAAAIEQRPQGTRSTGNSRSGPDRDIACPAIAAATPPAAIEPESRTPSPAFERPV